MQSVCVDVLRSRKRPRRGRCGAMTARRQRMHDKRIRMHGPLRRSAPGSKSAGPVKSRPSRRPPHADRAPGRGEPPHRRPRPEQSRQEPPRTARTARRPQGEGPTAWVSRHAVEPLRRGHPWLYRSALVSVSGRDAEPHVPQIVRLRDDVTDEPLGVGIHDPASPIAVRVWSTDPAIRLDAALFDARLAAALTARRALFAGGETTAYRLLNGEGDRTPGVVIDRYADVAVLRTDGDAVRVLGEELFGGLHDALRAIGVTTLLERSATRAADPGARQPPLVRFGPPRELVEVREHGVPFVVDVAHGQKTGAFLDQRDNRRRIGELVAARRAASLGVRVLNLFSYAGGFSVRAALAGGVVTSVDVAARAHATAQESFTRAGVDPSAHVFATADAFAWLEAAKQKRERFDVVISDPPSFAPNERSKPRALAAYRSLHRACVDVLAHGGHFVAASCSSHVAAEDFLGTLDDAALGRADLRLIELHGAPPDHPSLPTFPEGRYLKLAVLA